MATDAKFCGNCGSALRPGSRFCTVCGEAAGAQLASSPGPAAPPAEQATERTPPPYDAPPPAAYSGVGYEPSGLPGASASAPQIASLVSRFLALMVDGLAFFGVFYLVGSLVANTTDDPTEYGFNLEGGPAGIVIGISLVAFLAYYILLEGTIGATLGKLAMGIRVERRGGGPAGIAAAVIRTLLRLIDGIAGYLVGWIVALTSPLRQRLGDRAAGTVVTTAPRAGRTRLGALIAALVLAVLGTGAGVALRDPATDEVAISATLARGVTSDFRPVDPTDRFQPTQESFFVAFEYSGVEPGAEIRCVWYAVDVGNAAPPDSVIDEVIATAPQRSGRGSFNLRRSTSQWPVGTYKVELWVEDELLDSQTFAVAR